MPDEATIPPGIENPCRHFLRSPGRECRSNSRAARPSTSGNNLSEAMRLLSKWMRHTAECLQNLKDSSNLCCRLACFEIDNKPEADARNAGELILPLVLHLACAADLGADVGWAFHVCCHSYFPIGKLAGPRQLLATMTHNHRTFSTQIN